jgi:glycine reductase
VAREIEKAGIPTVIITSVPEVAKMVGVPRIVRGFGIPFPTGNPFLKREEEKAIRRAIIEKALESLQIAPTKPTVFWPNFGSVVGNIFE